MLRYLTRFRLYWVLIIALFTPQLSIAKTKSYSSGDKKVHLLELYSSEGCSSCPPAERWLIRQKNHSELWTNFVPVEFHVDYWNYLGWHDPFSNRSFSTRQRAYARQWGKTTVYTPRFVLNGQLVPHGRQQIPAAKGGNVGNLTAEKVGDLKYKIKFQPKSKHQNLQVYGALLGNGLVTQVKRGENAGETLRHEFVVLSLKKSKLTKAGKTYEAEITLPPSHTKKPTSFAVAFWLTSPKSLSPIQSVGGPL